MYPHSLSVHLGQNLHHAFFYHSWTKYCSSPAPQETIPECHLLNFQTSTNYGAPPTKVTTFPRQSQSHQRPWQAGRSICDADGGCLAGWMLYCNDYRHAAFCSERHLGVAAGSSSKWKSSDRVSTWSSVQCVGFHAHAVSTQRHRQQCSIGRCRIQATFPVQELCSYKGKNNVNVRTLLGSWFSYGRSFLRKGLSFPITESEPDCGILVKLVMSKPKTKSTWVP